MILSTEALDSQIARPLRRAVPDDVAGQAAPLERTRVVTRLNSLIRPQIWWNWLLISLGFLAWSATVAGGWQIDHSGSGLKDLFGLQTGYACRLFSLSALLAVTQLSLVILWYRTHSRKDFQGRYRIWIWSSVTWAMFLVGSVAGLHSSTAAWLAGSMSVQVESLSHLAWLTPAAVLFGATCRLLSAEMIRTPVDRWLLRGSVAVAAISGGLRIGVHPLHIPFGRECLNATNALWPLLLAAALLLHARYVIHVTNEAAPLPAPHRRRTRLAQQLWQEIRALGPSRASLFEKLKALQPVASRLGRACVAAIRRHPKRRGS